jgi:HK97 family phage major capsid protein
MDKNDMIRSRNEAANRVAEVSKVKADVLQLAVTEKRSNTADEETKLEKIQTDLDYLRSVLRAEDAKIAAFEATEDATKGAPSLTEDVRSADVPEIRDDSTEQQRASAYFASDDYAKVFSDYLRSKSSSEAEEVKRSIPDEFRAWGYSDANTGAPVVHRDFMNKVVELLYSTNGLISEIGRQTLGGQRKYVVEATIGTAGYRDPGDAYAESDGTIANANIDIFNLGKLVKVHEELLDDSEINLPNYLATKLGQAFANAAEIAAVLGTDAKGPTSLLAGITNTVNTAVTLAVSFEDLADLRALVPASGRAGGKFLMNPSTETLVMKLKDSDGRFLWSPSVREGAPGTIWGHEIILSDQVEDNLTVANEVAAFGDWNKYCTNYVRRDLSVRQLRELYAASGFVGYRGQMRHDLVNELPSAFGKLIIAA